MDGHQIEIVKRSWRSLQGINPALLGDVFYSKLFLENPSLERMFKSSKEVQAQKLIDMLDMVIKRLDNLEPLLDEIRAMAQRHVGYGVKRKHYAQVGAALIWTLKTSLGKDWNDDLAAAWLQCYQDLTDVMLAVQT
jgi:nitric oxide dioxygenase